MSLTGAVVPPREEELTEKSQRTDKGLSNVSREEGSSNHE